MPYKKSLYRKRYAKKKASPMTVSKIVKGSALKTLKKALGLNTEQKNWDAVYSASMSTSLATFLNPIAGLNQGITNNTRIGNGLRITHWKLQGRIANNVLNANQTRYRIIIILQKEVVNTVSGLSAAMVLQDPSNIDSPYNSDLTAVKVLYDKTFQLKPYFSGQVATNNFTFKWSPSYDDGHVEWNDADSSGVVAGQLKGILKVFCMADTPTNLPIFYSYSRVHFVDN